jgi:hypothetical protein
MGFLPLFVIPAKAGIQEICASLDSRLPMKPGFIVRCDRQVMAVRGNDVREACSDRLLEAVPLHLFRQSEPAQAQLPGNLRLISFVLLK